MIWSCANDPAGYATPIIVKIHGKRQAVFFTGKGLVSVNIRTGNILWHYAWKTAYKANVAAPIYHNSHIYISSGYNSGAALIKIIYQRGRFYTRLVWKTRKMKNFFSSSILWKGYIYGFHKSLLSCMEWKSGKILWRKKGFGRGTFVGVDGHLLILGERGTLALVKMNPQRYEEKGRAYLLKRGKYWTVPTICYGKLYIRNQTEIICLTLRKTTPTDHQQE